MRRVLLALLAAVLALTGCSASTTTTPPAPTTGASGLPLIAVSDLPAQAQQTFDLVQEGGPFPYSQDGQVFGNRERLLPAQENGWYREYTIPTPGSPDRGAARFVVGEDETFFYTDDHYDSFAEVIP